MNEPEFLLRCASSPSELWDHGAGEIPASILSLEESFKESEAGCALIAELDRIAAEEAEKSEASKKHLADFAAPTSKQIALLVGRGWKLVVRNPASLMRALSAIIFGGEPSLWSIT